MDSHTQDTLSIVTVQSNRFSLKITVSVTALALTLNLFDIFPQLSGIPPIFSLFFYFLFFTLDLSDIGKQYPSLSLNSAFCLYFCQLLM